jgi:phosphoadenosine phosphosulfate reductase
MTEQLQKKVDRAIKLIQSASKIAKENGCPEIEVAYSGGKDSDVILELTKMSGVPYRAIYKNTTIDPAGTIKHAQDMGAEIMRPKKTFAELLGKKGLPTRFRRFCCGVLKEYKILDYAILGVRREESVKRAKMYNEPEKCRVYSKNVKARHYFPILDWTKEDLKEFIQDRGVKLHPLYYNENGELDVTRRLGCMGCPLASRKGRINTFKEHPNLVKLYVRGGQKFLDEHPNSKIASYYKDGYEWFAENLFCKDVHEFQEQFGGNNLFGDKVDCKQFLEDYFKIKL